MDKFNLSGKTALITGAGGLLGKEHAKALLIRGCKVVLSDNNSKNLESASSDLSNQFNPDLVESVVMDVTSIEEIRHFARSMSDKSKRIDILINNASIDSKALNSGSIAGGIRLEKFSLEQWNLEIAVGLTGAFLCSQIFGSQMARDDLGGVILNISSDLSVISPDQRIYRLKNISLENQPVKPVTYSVIKTGLIGLTRYLATYWADKNIRCNALSPGGVYNGQSQEFVQHLVSRIPLGRMADVSEYHSAIQFLCSDASKYMNGQNLVMDGGRSIW